MAEETEKGSSLATDQRRGFLTKALAVACGGLATFPPLAAALWAVLDPLRRTAGAGNFVPVADLNNVPADGMPRQFPVIADRVDAWTGFAAEPIGAVYLKRDKGSETVEVLSATCPHAGCFVEMDRESKCFRCPCHNSAFTLDGGIVAPSPSPRPMDSLECKVDKGGGVLVKWQNFYTGIEEKVARP
jgi:menaquinol-cytochrome c reductase iron-sulfur subunit